MTRHTGSDSGAAAAGAARADFARLRLLRSRRGPRADPATSDRPQGGPGWAVLCDMDGLLVDSEPLWTVAEREIAQDFGGSFRPETKAAMMGQRLDRSIPILLAGIATPAALAADPLDVGERMLTRMVELLTAEVPWCRGARPLLDALAVADVATALVSSSFRRLVDAVLAGLPDPAFAETLAGDEVLDAKPAPEPYLTVAARLGLSPARCVVLEDSIAGLTSGLAAGCPCVLVPSMPGSLPTPLPRGRVVVCSSLEEVGVDLLRELAMARVPR